MTGFRFPVFRLLFSILFVRQPTFWLAAQPITSTPPPATGLTDRPIAATPIQAAWQRSATRGSGLRRWSSVCLASLTGPSGPSLWTSPWGQWQKGPAGSVPLASPGADQPAERAVRCGHRNPIRARLPAWHPVARDRQESDRRTTWRQQWPGGRNGGRGSVWCTSPVRLAGECALTVTWAVDREFLRRSCPFRSHVPKALPWQRQWPGVRPSRR
jgi:hypothetical protein